LYLPCKCACIEAGDAIEPGFELWLVERPAPGIKVGENGLGAWLAADEVGKGGEKGNGGYCIEACLLMFDTAGEAAGGSSSPPSEPRRAASLASRRSAT
jgi:hypothetical protein